MIIKSILAQNKAKNILKKTFLAFDVENNPYQDDKTNFLCACCYGYIKDDNRKLIKIEKTFLDKQEMQDFILSLPKKYKSNLAFFNLGYDKLYFEGILKDEKTLNVNGKCISFETKNGYKAIDLSKHTTMGSLENWIKWADLAVEKIPFEKGEPPKTATPELIKRCQNDTKATYLLAEFLQNFYNEQGVSMRLTLGSTALALFQKKYFKEFWRRTYTIDKNEITPQGKLEKGAFYGGWTDVFKKGKNNDKIKFWSYDINSAYLSVMLDEFYPVINKYIYYDEESEAEWTEKDLKELKKLFIADVLIQAPDTNIPYLPYRTKEKLLFGVGQWRASYTSVDIKEALKYGYKIKKVYQIIYYENKIKLFEKYSRKIWDLRAEFKNQNNKGMEKIAKLLGNALYGKFAQQNPVLDYLGDFEGYEKALINLEKTLNYKPARDIDYSIKRHRIDGNDDNDDESNILYQLTSSIKLPSRNYFPAISAFITSYCRRKLYRAMKPNAENLVYVDTDCIKLSKKAKKDSIKISNDLGDWGFEGIQTDTIFAPKLYANKKKGVRKGAELIRENEHEQVWRYKNPFTHKEALQEGNINLTNKWRWVEKVINKNDTKRIWDLKKGTSKPININDYTSETVPKSL